MTNARGNDGLVLVLPKLKRDSDVRPSDAPGKWDSQPTKAFQDVASSLEYKSPGRLKSISSVPTMWARPLSMEMALHNPSYPIRDQAIEQWRGMLAALALAELRRFPLKAELLDLGELRSKNLFARSLYELLPDPVNALYTLDGKNPWQDCYVFLWNDRPVGMTSPSTLVVPSEEGKWEGLPWWNSQEMRLESPNNYLNATEKALLWRWLDNLRGELQNYGGKDQAKAINAISGLVNEFRDSLGFYPDQRLSLSENPQYFTVPLNRGVLKAINIPVKAQARPSSVKLVPSPEKKDKVEKDLLIIDQGVAIAWNESQQNIWVYEEQTLASLRIEDLRDKKLIWSDVEWLESKDLFLPEFKFIDLEDALPGAFLPNGDRLFFNSRNITPLLPLNPILLKYLTPEDLIGRVRLSPINGSDGPILRVQLDLPLSGLGNDDSNPSNYRVFKDYPLKEENALPEVPVLEVWPHFRAKNWKEYYCFYYDAEYGNETFQVSFPDAKLPHSFKDGRGNYQIARLEEFPSYIECKSNPTNTLGLILLQTPEVVKPTGLWTVGVDFGTSFTNVYANRKGRVEPLPLENLHLKITEVQRETRNPVLFEYFIPESFIPPEKPLPLSSVLTTRGQPGNNSDKERPIYEGRIYVPDRNRFKPEEDWIVTDLKWKNLIPNRLFLKHFALHIAAQAVKNGVDKIDWALSFPSAFSNGDRNRYAKTWQRLTKELQEGTGIDHVCPEPDKGSHFRTESLAIAQYFADQERLNFVKCTCIDVGGGTSDISIWEKNVLVHQCSVQLAGRHLFSEILELKPDFLVQKFKQNSEDWNGLREGNFSAKLDVFLRLESEKWLEDEKTYVEDDPDFKGLARVMAIGMAGLYYYVGMLLGVLHDEGKYSLREITQVYVGGNGSRLLNWLAEGGSFDRHSEINELLSRMLSDASEFPDTKQNTQLSGRPKDEVACGLVLRGKTLTGMDKKAKDPLIAGEDCEVNGDPIGWNSRLELEGDIQSFEISDFKQLRRFVNDFHVALKELSMESIMPLEGYNLASDPEDPDPDENARLWGKVRDELTDMLLDKEQKNAEDIRVEPPFILEVKALLHALAKEWAGR